MTEKGEVSIKRLNRCRADLDLAAKSICHKISKENGVQFRGFRDWDT